MHIQLYVVLTRGPGTSLKVVFFHLHNKTGMKENISVSIDFKLTCLKSNPSYYAEKLFDNMSPCLISIQTISPF